MNDINWYNLLLDGNGREKRMERGSIFVDIRKIKQSILRYECKKENDF